MTWKSTALVSGASVLAAWLGVTTSPVVPRPASAPASRPARSQTMPDIQEQAAHLQSRLPASPEYVPPVRNPFQFGERREPARPRVAPPPLQVAAPPVPAGPPFTIAGIGGTDTDGTMNYTAVLSTSAGVRLARTGDIVDGGYRVESVDEGGVTVRAADGHTERLSLPK